MIYSLPSLNGREPAEVEGILANLTLGMLPSPTLTEESSPPKELRERLINEIRIRLRLKKEDYSSKAMSKIYDYLAKEIGRVALAQVDVKEIKSRLGQRGDLAASLYKVEFTPQFVDGYERHGVDRANVELALRAPDGVEHVHPAGLGIEDDKATSLYLKRFSNSSKPSNAFTLLVACQRIGYVQRVGHAWMIFHSDVDLSKAKTPSEVLRAFVDKYGLDITVGEKTGRFFWYERVAVPRDKKTNIVTFKHIEGLDMEVNFQQGLIFPDAVEIVYAFSINNTAYEADLLKHGIKTKPLPPRNKSR